MSEHDEPGREAHPPDEALSAFVDGVVPEGEAVDVAAHVAGCATCAATVSDLRLVHEVLRELPLVDPPSGFYERTLRLGPRPRSSAGRRLGVAVGAGLVAVLAVAVVVGAVQRRFADVRPPLDATATADFSQAIPEPASAAAGDPGGGLPATIGGLPYRDTIERDGVPYRVYVEGTEWLAVTWDDGEVDERVLPEAVTVAVPGGRGWYVDGSPIAVLVVEREGRVYTVLLPAGTAPVPVVTALPGGGDPSVADRVQAAGRSLLEAFGFG